MKELVYFMNFVFVFSNDTAGGKRVSIQSGKRKRVIMGMTVLAWGGGVAISIEQPQMTNAKIIKQREK